MIWGGIASERWPLQLGVSELLSEMTPAEGAGEGKRNGNVQFEIITVRIVKETSSAVCAGKVAGRGPQNK